MNVLFLTLLAFDSVQERTLYTDLLREFVKNGHHVYVISPVEKRQKQKTKRSSIKNSFFGWKKSDQRKLENIKII